MAQGYNIFKKKRNMTLGSKSYLKLLSPWIVVNVAVPLSLILQPASSNLTSEDNLNKSTATASKKRPPFLPVHETTKKAKKRHVRKNQK